MRRIVLVALVLVVIVIVTLLTLLLGAKSIEKSNKVMMPVFFIIFVVLAVRVAFLPGASAGYKMMFTPGFTLPHSSLPSVFPLTDSVTELKRPRLRFMNVLKS